MIGLSIAVLALIILHFVLSMLSLTKPTGAPSRDRLATAAHAVDVIVDGAFIGIGVLLLMQGSLHGVLWLGIAAFSIWMRHSFPRDNWFTRTKTREESPDA